MLNDAIQTTGWQHIVATFNANTMQIVFFIDGVKVLLQDSLIEKIAPCTTALTIGAIERDHKDRTKVSTFRGRLDEVKIWSKALTAEYVQKYYGHMFVKSAPVSPAHLATVANARPLLSWTAARDGTAAILELSSTPGFIADKTLGGRKAPRISVDPASARSAPSAGPIPLPPILLTGCTGPTACGSPDPVNSVILSEMKGPR